MRILVVDDHAAVRRGVRALLSSRPGWSVCGEAEDGLEAVERAKTLRPDIVLMDVSMPRMDGIEATRIIRREIPEVEVIIVSQNDPDVVSKQAAEVDARGYVAKANMARDLLPAVERASAGRNGRKASNSDDDRKSELQVEDEIRILERVGETLASDLDLQRVVQAATDAGRQLSGAGFGAFFYNVKNDKGESYMLYTLSGAAPEDFSKFPMPRNTCVFAPTFNGEGTLRLDDVTKDQRYGHNSPYYGTPPGHLPVRSYLAVPVVSRSGEVLGGLFYGHPQSGIFTERAERLVQGIARHAAIAIDNARLFEEVNRARAEAHASAERLRLSQQAARVGSFEWNIKTDVNRWTPELESMHGLPTGGFSGTLSAWEQLLHPEDRDEATRRLRDGLGESSFEGEWRVVWPDGSVHWMLCRAVVFRDKAGEPERMLGVNIDVSERKEAELADNLLAAIVDSSDDAIISKSLESIITSWNTGAERLFGYTKEEAVGKHIFLIIPRERRDEEATILERLKRGERVDHFETLRLHRDGTLRELSLTISPVKDATGKVVGASKVARDITERKRNERALRESEEREKRITAEAVAANAKFRAVFEQTSVFAGIMELDGTFIDANRLCLEACGYTAEEVLGKLFWKTAWWRGSKEVQDKIKAATKQAAQGTAYSELLPYHCADGSERIVNFALHPIQDNQGKVIFLHPTGVDITDLKRAEDNYRALAESLDAEVRTRTQELEQRNTEILEQSDRLRELSNRILKTQDEERRRMARELHDSAGQLIAALGMNLTSITANAKHDPSLAKALEDTQGLVQQLNREIRTTSYLLHPPLLDENGLAQAIQWYMQGLMERSGLEIELNIPEDFGRLPADLELAVFRIVQECLTNIHRHSGSKTANISLRRNGGCVSLEIHDHGQGISPEKLAAIKGQRSGVGITGMRERVRHFKGQMDVQSNGGATILVTLPIPADPPSGADAILQSSEAAR